MTWAPSCPEDRKGHALKQQVESLKMKLNAAAHRQKVQPVGVASYHGVQEVPGRDEELFQRVQKLEAQCLDQSSQVEYLTAVYEQSQSRVLELEGAKERAQAQAELNQQLEVTLRSNATRIQELEAALEESVGLVHKWEGAHSEGKAQVDDLEAKMAHLHEYSAQVPQLKAQLDERISRVRELEEKHLEHGIISLEEQAKQDAKSADAVQGDLKRKVVLLEKSNGELLRALDARNAEVAKLKETMQALTSSHATPRLDLRCARSGSAAIGSARSAHGGSATVSSATVAGLAFSPPRDGSVRRMITPVSPRVGGPTPAGNVMASPRRCFGTSPVKGRVSPLAPRAGMRVPGPVLGARMSSAGDSAAIAPASSPGPSVSVNGNISEARGRSATPQGYANLHQPQQVLLIRAVG